MQLISIAQTTAVYWVNLKVKTSIDRKELDFCMYYYLQLTETVNYILKDIFIYTIKEECSDEEEST